MLEFENAITFNRPQSEVFKFAAVIENLARLKELLEKGQVVLQDGRLVSL